MVREAEIFRHVQAELRKLQTQAGGEESVLSGLPTCEEMPKLLRNPAAAAARESASRGRSG